MNTDNTRLSEMYEQVHTTTLINETHDSGDDNLLKGVPDHMIQYGRAVAVCSAIVEFGKDAATIDQIIDTLTNRYKGNLPREHIASGMEDALMLAVQHGMIELTDKTIKRLQATNGNLETDMSFKLTANGKHIGRDWLLKIKTNWPFSDPSRN